MSVRLPIRTQTSVLRSVENRIQMYWIRDGLCHARRRGNRRLKGGEGGGRVSVRGRGRKEGNKVSHDI